MTSATNATTPTTSIDPRKGSYESLPNPNSLYNLASNPNFTNQARPTGSLLEKLRALRENPETQEIPILPSSPILTEFTEQSRNTVNEQFIPAEMGQGGINIDSFENLEAKPPIQETPPILKERELNRNVVPKTEKTEVIGEKLDTKPEQVQEKPVKNQLFSLLAPLIKEWQKNFMPAGQEIKEAEKPNFEKVIKLIRSNRDSYSEIEKAAVSLINKEHKNN